MGQFSTNFSFLVEYFLWISLFLVISIPILEVYRKPSVCRLQPLHSVDTVAEAADAAAPCNYVRASLTFAALSAWFLVTLYHSGTLVRLQGQDSFWRPGRANADVIYKGADSEPHHDARCFHSPPRHYGFPGVSGVVGPYCKRTRSYLIPPNPRKCHWGAVTIQICKPVIRKHKARLISQKSN